MLLDATTDNLEIILDKAKTTNDLSFSVFYNEYTSTTVTPMSNYGATNGTTAVNLISAPAIGKQRQLRNCMINNVDTVDVGVKIRFNDNGSFRNAVYVYLRVNESLQYTEEMGWRVYTSDGYEKNAGYIEIPGAIRMPEWFATGTATTALTTTNGTSYCLYLGRAERPFSTVKLQYNVVRGLSGAGAWGEIAIYKGAPTVLTNTGMTRMGYTDVTSAIGTVGVKTTSVTTPNMAIGDDLWAVYSSSGTTATQYRAGLADNLGAGFYQTSATTRPSTSASFTGTIDSTTSVVWTAWQGVYQGT